VLDRVGEEGMVEREGEEPRAGGRGVVDPGRGVGDGVEEPVQGRGRGGGDPRRRCTWLLPCEYVKEGWPPWTAVVRRRRRFIW